MDEPQRCPIDYEAAQVGDVIPSGLISSLSGLKPGTLSYSAYQAELANHIERALWERDKPFVVRKRRFTLVILTHSEAAEFTRRETRRGVRKLIRNNERMQAVDTAQLTDKEGKRHGKALVVSGAVVAGIMDSPIVARLATKRQTPGLDSWTSENHPG